MKKNISALTIISDDFVLIQKASYDSITKEEKEYLIYENNLNKICEVKEGITKSIVNYLIVTFKEENGSVNKVVRKLYQEDFCDLQFDVKKEKNTTNTKYKVVTDIVDSENRSIGEKCIASETYTLVRGNIIIPNRASVFISGRTVNDQTMVDSYVIYSPFRIYLSDGEYNGTKFNAIQTISKENNRYKINISFKRYNFYPDATVEFKPIFSVYKEETNKKLFDAEITIEFITSYTPVGD